MAGSAIRLKATRTTSGKLIDVEGLKKNNPNEHSSGMWKGTRKTHFRGVFGKQYVKKHKARSGKNKGKMVRKKTFAGGYDTGRTGQPLIQEGHQSFQPRFSKDEAGKWMKNAQGPMDMRQVADSPSAIFSLTGGYIPTFTEDFNNIDQFYRNYAGGMIVMNEAMTREGPGPMMMRGNHVWYNYANDYLDAVSNLGEASPNMTEEGYPQVDAPESMWDTIFDMYISNSNSFVKPLMEQWAKNLKIPMEEELRVTSDELKNISRSDVQAPEEAMVQLMALRDDRVTKIDTGATGGARGLDVQLTIKTADKITKKTVEEVVQWDATQSKATSGGTHTAMGTLSLKVAQDAKNLDDNIAEYHTQAQTYFERSEKHLNLMLLDLHNYAMAAQKKNKDYEKMDVRQILQAEGFKTGDDWSKAGTISKKIGSHYTKDAETQKVLQSLGYEAKEEFKRAYIAQAYDSAMHILGLSSGLTNPAWTDQVAGELPLVLGKHKKSSLGYDDKLPVIFMADWMTLGLNSIKEPVQLQLTDVWFDYEASTYSEIIMKRDLGYDEERIVRTLADGNLMWNFYDLMVEGESISTGLATYDSYQKITGAGYHVAMGGVTFVEQEFNKNLAKALEKIVAKSIANPAQHTGLVQKTMKEGLKQGQSFSNLWKTGAFGGDLIQIEGEAANPESPDFVKYATEANQFLEGKDETELEEWSQFNALIRNYTWAIPYVGIHYQGGKSQKIEPMLR